MTEKQIKEILDVRDWAEVKRPEQFSVLLANFHLLAPGVRSRIVSKIPDITDLTSRFYDYCADALIAYEPTVIMVLAPLIKLMDMIKSETGGKIVKEDRVFVSDVYNAFSIWYGRDAEMLWSNESHDDICTIDEAIKLVKDAEANKGSALDMTLLTQEREPFLAALEKTSSSEYTIDVEFINKLLGDEAGAVINEKDYRKYIN